MLHQLRFKQLLHTDIQTLWSFMSSPDNLALITPAYMNFEILTGKEDLGPMYAGQIIEYYLQPLGGIKMYWVTEITHVKEPEFFVDEQRFGPYRFWHHKHHLKEVENGVEMLDILHYQIPCGFIGRIANALIVKKKIEDVFEFRRKKLETLFNQK